MCICLAHATQKWSCTYLIRVWWWEPSFRCLAACVCLYTYIWRTAGLKSFKTYIVKQIVAENYLRALDIKTSWLSLVSSYKTWIYCLTHWLVVVTVSYLQSYKYAEFSTLMWGGWSLGENQFLCTANFWLKTGPHLDKTKFRKVSEVNRLAT